MASFTLKEIDKAHSNEETFRFVSDAGHVVEFLVLYPEGRDNRSYALKDFSAPQDVVDRLEDQFTTVMRYAEFKRDPQIGFQLEV